ncbi:MAG: carboxypeptidase regulatory-like domain-containing protein [Phycisphaerae bacterium]|nr:carboxypeptidase regulatory-like domain-containing protein [Phycisphaerae bacterium]
MVRHADLMGKVFILSQKEEARGAPAQGVFIQVRDVETNELLAETRTDREGAYEFPRFDVGIYHLMVGALRLRMEVVPESEDVNELAKVVILILPEEMARGGRPSRRR